MIYALAEVERNTNIATERYNKKIPLITTRGIFSIVIPHFADNLYLIVIPRFLFYKKRHGIYEFLFIINTLIVIPPFLLCKNGQGIYEFLFLLGSKRKGRNKSEDALTLVYTSET